MKKMLKKKAKGLFKNEEIPKPQKIVNPGLYNSLTRPRFYNKQKYAENVTFEKSLKILLG